MANVFSDQARERFTRSLAFMNKAETLLKDDLVYRSALADGISAIKNMLQGYLLLKIAAMPSSAVTQRWQEIAASNRMPELVQAATEAGLDLRGLAHDIRRLNNERNFRAHDDPDRRINAEQAQRAYDLALAVQRNIRRAVQSAPELAEQRQGTVTKFAAVARAAVSGQLGRSTATHAVVPAPAGQANPAHKAADTEESHRREIASVNDAPDVAASESMREALPETVDGPVADVRPESADNPVAEESSPDSQREPSPATELDEDTDTGELPSLPVRRPRERGIVRLLRRSLIAAVLLVIGALLGIGVTIPAVGAGTPSWLQAALSLTGRGMSATTATATPAATVGRASATVSTMSEFAGDLAIGPAICANGVQTVTLRNLGANAMSWSIASEDAPDARFALAGARTGGAASLAGTIASSEAVEVRVTASDPAYHIVVIDPQGAAMLAVAAC